MKAIQNSLTELLEIDYPIIQAPMGWIARSQLGHWPLAKHVPPL